VQQVIKHSSSSEETFEIGQLLAKDFIKGQVLLFEGVLGAGKTQLIKGICHHFGLDSSQVQSPTYSLHHNYPTPKLLIDHFDLYRLKDSKEFLERGFYDTLQASDLCLVEWPSKIDQAIFNNFCTIKISLKITGESSREIIITYG
jgi:tRNA threonylcarbamoyladenosine biosynthesis protein TsaE